MINKPRYWLWWGIFCILMSANLTFAQPIDLFNRKIDTIKSLEEFNAMTAAMLNHKNMSGAKIGISIYSMKQNKFIYKHNANMPLIPASVSKLFTSFMALCQLGGSGTINTTVYTDAKEIKPELEGNIYLFGRGDALLSASDLEVLASKIRALGIKVIKGNIYADGSFFDKSMYRYHYSGDADEVEYVPPIAALSMERNTASVIISGGSVPGRPVNVQVLPTSAGFITNVGATVRGGAAPKKKATKKRSKSRSMNDIEFEEDYQDEPFLNNPNIQEYGDFALAARRKKAPARRQKAVPARSSVAVSTSVAPSGKQVIQVTGSINTNGNVKRYFPLSAPDVVVAGALLERLKAVGISVTGELSQKHISSLPDTKHVTMLAEFQRPIGSILSLVNKNSDNYLAENIFKMVGANSGNRENNKLGAVSYYQKMFDSLGFPENKNCFNDGSGLSRRNLASAESIAYLLELSKKKEFGEVIDTSLSIAGRDGTLRRRFIGTPAENNLKGKTGTHKNVSALAGYVHTLDGDTLCFSIISNGWAVGQYKQFENAMGIMMSSLMLKD